MPKEQAGSIADDVKMKPGHKRQFINGLELIDSAAAQMKALQLAAVEAATPATTDAEVCPRCGTKQRDEGRFCGKCGKPLDVPESPRDGPSSPRSLSIGQKSSDNI